MLLRLTKMPIVFKNAATTNQTDVGYIVHVFVDISGSTLNVAFGDISIGYDGPWIGWLTNDWYSMLSWRYHGSSKRLE